MANVVFILGAGASKLAGAPLMGDFLEVADNLLRRNKVPDKKEHFERVLQACGKLQAVLSKSRLDISNIEAVFNALELARIVGKFPEGDEGYVEETIASLQEVISTTLEETIIFPVRNKKVLPPAPYQEFANLVDHLRTYAYPQHSVAVISFNYDLAVDYAFYFNSLGPDYRFPESTTRGVPLLKLHGSTNWIQCPECDQVVPWELGSFFDKYRWPFLDDVDSTKLDISQKFENIQHCDKPLPRKPFLVPPTWNKTDHQLAIGGVWRQAAKELTDAEHIFIIGYSIPETDAFFRLLFSIGTVGPLPLKRLWVFNPDSSGRTEQRYRQLVGTGAESCFQYFIQEFDSAMSRIEQQFPRANK